MGVKAHVDLCITLIPGCLIAVVNPRSVNRVAVSIMPGYRLDDRTIEFRSPAEIKDLSCSLCVQTGSGAHPASCTMGIGVHLPGDKARPGRDANHSPPSSAEVENE
jgi:hypothetical protein